LAGQQDEISPYPIQGIVLICQKLQTDLDRILPNTAKGKTLSNTLLGIQYIHMKKRRRPKKQDLNTKKHVALRRKWRSWLPAMFRDLTDLQGKREIFWELQDVAKENPKILSPGAFFDWMCRNYISAMVLGIRSFVDYRKDVHSLGRMLYEILENPGVISRKSHVSLYRGITNGLDMGNRTFDAVAGHGKQLLSQMAIRSDMKKIEDASEKVRRFANKRIAHRAPPGELRKLPTFDELDSSLDVIDKVFCKYNLLLRAEGASSTRATRQYDWMRVLWEPWVREGSKFRPEI
jgi:hypothetical protein